MTFAQLIDWLVLEVDDLLGAGAVGVYEFIEILRSREDPPSDETLREVAVAALDRLLTTKVAKLEWRRWAEDWSAQATPEDLSDAGWETPTEVTYLAVVPA